MKTIEGLITTNARTAFAFAFAALVTTLSFSACSNGAVTLASQIDSGGGGFGGAGVGAKCDASTPCRPGLSCTAGLCAPGFSSATGTACVISDECVKGDYCGPARTCVAAGAGVAGATCQSDADCISGLRCDVVGLAAECQPEGTTDVGGACKTSADCFEGLACTASVCTPLPPGATAPLAIPTWAGAKCPPDDTSGGAVAYFTVPGSASANVSDDFFRLPFPNDVRILSGHPNIPTFPTPGSEILGFDVVNRYAAYIAQAADGWSTYTSIIMRFNESPDLNSLSATNALAFWDLTANTAVGFQWSATTGRTPYICPNSITARPLQGAPLIAGHTYAFLMTNVVKASDETVFKPSSDLTALVAAVAPQDTTLAAAYAAYKPLRTWAATAKFDLTTLTNAAVFTTMHAQNLAENIQTAALAATAPAATSWTLCDGTNVSPCPQADPTQSRACPTTVDPNFYELHALVPLPIFQQGNEPYLTPADGGDFVVDGTGAIKFQRTESVCMALTIPKTGTMPAGGWPVVIFAHGTGGSFRDIVNQGVAGMVSQIDGAQGVAVIGIDQVEHGTRRGSSTDSPDNLFFNFANPAAAVGNPLQGSADQVSMLRFVQGLDLAAASSPTKAEIKFGTTMFWGHSQGATEGGIAMPYMQGISAAIFSGQGASLIDALLTKTNPVDIANVLPVVLEDPNVSAGHPVLTVLQNALDPADPLNHASSLLTTLTAPANAKSVFQVYGQSDTYAPPVTENTFAIAAALGVAAPPASVTNPDKIESGTTNPVPYGGNFPNGITGVVRQYTPETYDGHFVAFMNPDAMKDVEHFIADVAATPATGPKVGR